VAPITVASLHVPNGSGTRQHGLMALLTFYGLARSLALARVETKPISARGTVRHNTKRGVRMRSDRDAPTSHLVRGDLSREQAAVLSQCERVACDTETSGLDWNSDRLDLWQVFAPELGAILVQITDEVPARIVALMEDPSVVKIFHHAPFDLRLFAAPGRSRLALWPAPRSHPSC
jgi:hypothetical protein